MQAEDILAIGETSGGLVEALKGEGYKVTLVKTASEALEEVKKRLLISYSCRLMNRRGVGRGWLRL